MQWAQWSSCYVAATVRLRGTTVAIDLEGGTTRIAGHLPDLELAAVQWQAGQHQPDALAVLVVAHDVAVHSAGRQLHIATPDLTARLGDTRPEPGATVTPLNSRLRRKISTQPTMRRTGRGAGWGLPVGFGDTGLLDPAERQ